MSRNNKTLAGIVVALFFALYSRAENEPVPDLGSRTADGFVVRCYWVGVFDSTLRFGGQALHGTFAAKNGGGMTGEQKTHATFILTQEVDDHGKMRVTPRAAHWSSEVSHLNYWSADGDRPSAGAGGSGGGEISPADMRMDVAEANGVVKMYVDFNLRPGGYSFDVRYHPLEVLNLIYVRVSAEEKTARWDAGVWGFSANEPVDPKSRKLVIRHELGNPGAKSKFYEKWEVTRVCESANVHLVEPGGTKRQYTFTGAKPGVLALHFKAVATPGSAGILEKIKDRVQFKIEGIGNSKMEWDAANPGGKAVVEGGFLTAKLKFVGMPAKNDDFGKKKVELLVDGNPVESASVKVFFPKFATNHPNGKTGDPNWFYYWQEGDVCGIGPKDSYDDSVKYGETDAEHDKNVRLGPYAPGLNDGPDTLTATDATYGSIKVGGHGKGIKCVAETIEHEKHHIAIYEAYHKQIAATATIDADHDHIPDTAEATLDDIKSDPANSDTYNLVGLYGPTYSSYGDEDTRCRKKEMTLTILYHVEKDWANPGCQTLPKPYGP